MQRVVHAPAYLLHQRPWGDAGRIFELFSEEHGRLSVFAQGVRGAKARLAGVMQPFAPLLVSWAGRGESPRLTGAEFDTRGDAGAPLPQARLMSAWYLNELVLSLTLRHDPQPQLYAHYAAALQGLRSSSTQERALRLFEKRLLDTLGYGLADLSESAFDDPTQLERARPVLRAAVARCLEGRSLKTRVVAQSLREFGRSFR